MKPCSENIWPDGFTGAVFALEGIKDGVVILNGPTGCKFYHSAISDYQYPRDLSFDPLNYPEIFYFGQPRVPATFLDGYDYVYGAGAKLQKILQRVGEKKEYKLVAVVNSPGAALIGDDLERLVKQEMAEMSCLCIENTGFSGLFTEGFQNASLQLLHTLKLQPTTVLPKTVNLVGLSIYHKHHSGSIKELKRLLAQCGIKLITTFCAGSSIAELQQCNRAALNVLLYPEYGLDLCQWMEAQLGVPYLAPSSGLPVGFEACESWIGEVAGRLSADAHPAWQEIEAARAHAFMHLSRFNSVTGLPRGASFAVKAEPALATALTVWLHQYLGMIPLAVETLPTQIEHGSAALYTYLQRHGLEAAMNHSVLHSRADVVFADGNTLAQVQLLQEWACCGIEIALPSLGYLDVVDKSIFGPSGTLLFLEQVLNGLRFVYA
ncbi:MAG: nitrogenase component 1 [Syntrophomonadaceae bacterium]